MGRLERHLDRDLIARMRAGNKHKPKPVMRQSDRREADTYRGARRNEARGSCWHGVGTPIALTPLKGKIYRPNGDRERWRRRRRMIQAEQAA